MLKSINTIEKLDWRRDLSECPFNYTEKLDFFHYQRSFVNYDKVQTPIVALIVKGAHISLHNANVLECSHSRHFLPRAWWIVAPLESNSAVLVKALKAKQTSWNLSCHGDYLPFQMKNFDWHFEKLICWFPYSFSRQWKMKDHFLSKFSTIFSLWIKRAIHRNQLQFSLMEQCGGCTQTFHWEQSVLLVGCLNAGHPIHGTCIILGLNPFRQVFCWLFTCGEILSGSLIQFGKISYGTISINNYGNLFLGSIIHSNRYIIFFKYVQ